MKGTSLEASLISGSGRPSSLLTAISDQGPTSVDGKKGRDGCKGRPSLDDRGKKVDDRTGHSIGGHFLKVGWGSAEGGNTIRNVPSSRTKISQ